MNQILSTSDSLTEIALQNGFSDVRSMSALFKKKYGILPGQYRSRHLDFMPQARFMSEVNYLAVTSSSALAPLARYLNENPLDDTPKETSGKEKIMNIENINIQKRGHVCAIPGVISAVSQCPRTALWRNPRKYCDVSRKNAI